MALWVEKYRPRSTADLVGIRKPVEEIREFITGFRPGKGLLLHGPSGVGKTLVATLVAAELERDLIEITASDERGKEAILGYLSAARTRSLFSRGKVIFVDEVDALAGGDRGGAPAIAELIRKSAFPIVLAANDPWLPKLRPLRALCSMVKFTRPPSPSIEKFLRLVCEKEGIQPQGSMLKNVARFSEGDLRSALTDLQTVCTGRVQVGDDHLEAIGFRERVSRVTDILPTLFRSGRIATGRRLLLDATDDPDDIFWWLETGAPLEFSGADLQAVVETLAKADRFRALVMKQQNWGFKGYMVDLMAGISVFHRGSDRYVAHRAPDRLVQLGRSRQYRQQLDEVCSRLGKELHCSKRQVRRELPVLRTMLDRLGLDDEDVAILRAGFPAAAATRP